MTYQRGVLDVLPRLLLIRLQCRPLLLRLRALPMASHCSIFSLVFAFLAVARAVSKLQLLVLLSALTSTWPRCIVDTCPTQFLLSWELVVWHLLCLLPKLIQRFHGRNGTDKVWVQRYEVRLDLEADGDTDMLVVRLTSSRSHSTDLVQQIEDLPFSTSMLALEGIGFRAVQSCLSRTWDDYAAQPASVPNSEDVCEGAKSCGRQGSLRYRVCEV